MMKYLKRLEKQQELAAKCLNLFTRFNEAIEQVIQTIWEMSDDYKEIVLQESLYKKMRFLSFPWHWVIIWIWSNLNNDSDHILFDEEGLQVFSGNTGCGKTSVLYEGIERDRLLNYKPWYVNGPFEKPRTDIEAGIKFKHHEEFEFEQFWSNYKMHFLPNHIKYGGIAIDEVQYELDYRQTMTKDYKAKFNPFRDYAILVRHYIKKIWLTTQMERVDKQLMQLAKYFHIVRIDIGFDYEDWMIETGAFRLKILGWYIDSYKIDSLSESITKNLYLSWYLRQEYADFDYYDTYSMRGAFDHVPIDNRRVQN